MFMTALSFKISWDIKYSSRKFKRLVLVQNPPSPDSIVLILLLVMVLIETLSNTDSGSIRHKVFFNLSEIKKIQLECLKNTTMSQQFCNLA